MEITWSVECNSQEVLSHVLRIVRKETDLNKIFLDVILTYPNGIELRDTESHKFGDYFDNIEIVPKTDKSFDLVFHIRQDARRFWKDLAVFTLETISVPGVVIKWSKS